MRELSNLNLREKKYIILDMDGTLIDSIGVWNQTDQKLIEAYGGPSISLDSVQRERDAFLHENQDRDIYLAYCDYLIQKYHLNIQDAKELVKRRWDISGQILEFEMDFKKDAVELIRMLKDLGFTLILATMTTQIQLDIYTKKNKKMLEQMNIVDVFDLIVRKEDVKNKKPHPEIYNKIVEYYHACPSECLVFEDSYTGVFAASQAGMEVVNIYDKYSDIDRDRINKVTDYAIDNYQEFIDFVNLIYRNTLEKIKS